MKKASWLEKGSGVFLFKVVLKLILIKFSVYWQPSSPPPTSFMLGFADRTGDSQRLPGLLQFRPQCQNFCLAGQSTPVSRIERDLFQVMPDP
jgi:hypothetical protein